MEEDVCEAGAEVCTVDGRVAGRFWVEQVLAAWAVQLHVLSGGEVRHSGGKEMGRDTVDTGALSEVAFLVLLELHESC